MAELLDVFMRMLLPIFGSYESQTYDSRLRFTEVESAFA